MLRWKRLLVILSIPALFAAGLAGASSIHTASSHHVTVAANRGGGGPGEVYQNGGFDGG